MSTLLSPRSRFFRVAVGGLVAASMVAALAPAAEARPRGHGYAHSGRPYAPLRRHRWGGDGAALAAIAGVAAIGIGAAIASSQKRRAYEVYDEPHPYGYRYGYGYEPIYDSPPDDVTVYEEPAYAPPPVYRPAPVYRAVPVYRPAPGYAPPPAYAHRPAWAGPYGRHPHISRGDWHRLSMQEARDKR